MKVKIINKKVYDRFMRRFNNYLSDHVVESFSISAIQWVDKNNKIIISCKYEKIAGIVSKSFYYNRIKQ